MDVFFIIINIVLIIIFILMSVRSLKHFIKTRFTPSYMLYLFFLGSLVSFMIYLPVGWLPVSQKEIAMILLNVSYFISLITIVFLVLFIEGVKGNILSPLSFIYINITTILITYSSKNNWYFQYDSRWHQLFETNYAIFTGIHNIFGMGILLVSLLIFIRELNKNRESDQHKKSHAIKAIYGLSIGLFGLGISYLFNIANFDILFLMIGILIFSKVYFDDPNSLFIADVQAKAITIFHLYSGIPLVSIGECDSNRIAWSGLSGVSLMLKEISGSTSPPKELIHLDRIYLMEYIEINNELYAIVIILKRKSIGIRSTMKYALKDFISQYNQIDKNALNIFGYDTNYEERLKSMFDYLYSKYRKNKISIKI